MFMKKIESKRMLIEYNLIFREMDEVYRQIAEHYGLSECAFWILYAIRESDNNYTQSDLCRILSLSKQTINSALKKLEENEYIMLQCDERNRRNKRIIFTKSGEKLANNTVDKVFEVEEKTFSYFENDDAEKYMEYFRKHLRILREEARKDILEE